MPTSYTSLLGLALPVTGELSGTWGDTVNDYITRYVDASVAGTQTISGSQTAVTLTVTNGTTLTQVGSGSSGSAQYAVINCTGNPAGLLTITAPASSRNYLIINATSTSQSVKIVGAGPTTGVTLVTGESAIVAWNGSDYVKVASSTADGVTTFSAGTTGFTPSTATSGAVTLAGTLATTNGGTGLTSFTANGVVYASSTSALTTGSALTFDGTTVTSTGGSLYLNGTNSDTAMTGSYVRFGTNIGLQSNAANSALVAKMFNGSTFVDALTLNTSGNLGLGVTPSAWNSQVTALQVKNGASFYGYSNGTNGDAGMATNQFVNAAGNRVYLANGFAAFYDQKGDTGAHRWFTAASGTAGNTISFTQAMTLDASGNLGVGVTSPQARFDLAGDYKEGVVTANTGTAYTINTANGTLQILTLTGNCTFTFPTAIAGESFTLLLRQDGTGSRTVTWPAAVRWPGGTAPTITATASQTDKYIFTSDGTRWYGSNAGQAYAA